MPDINLISIIDQRIAEAAQQFEQGNIDLRNLEGVLSEMYEVRRVVLDHVSQEPIILPSRNVDMLGWPHF